MDAKATAILQDGTKVQGRLTTAHAASSYGQPVFVDDNGQAYNWMVVRDIITTDEKSKGGKSRSDAKRKASAKNGRKGGRPKKSS